jgi:putative membrane protein
MPERENVGSEARDQLANERTFLAWVRTGLGLIGVGVVLAKWVESGTTTLFGGLSFIGWGAVVMAYALVRYRRITRLLEDGRYEPARRGPLLLTLAGLLAAGVATAVALL